MVRVWRIEKFNVVDWPEEDYGTFFDGDSFIILNGYMDGDALKYNVHFWLGTDTSQDEAGTAAYKTVELDDLLGDLPVQYREVQGHESKHFKALFGNMTILKGGVDTGFRHVEPESYPARLLHIQTKKVGRKKKTQTREVNCTASELNTSDCFVLDLGGDVFQFKPEGASVWEKRETNQIVENIFSMRNGRVTKHDIDFDDDSEAAGMFWEALGGKPDSLPETTERKQQNDQAEEAMASHVNQLLHVTNASGNMTIELKQEGVLDKAILEEEADDVLIVDVGRIVYVWLGPQCNKEEIGEAMYFAQAHLANTGRPNWTPITRVSHGAEPADFWRCFGCEHVSQDIC